MKKSGPLLAAEEKMGRYKQFESVRSVFSNYENVFSDMRGSELGQRVTVAVSGSGEAGAAGGIRPGQSSKSLLRELVSCFSHPGNLVVDLVAVTLSRGVACITGPPHLVLLCARRIRKAFVWRKETVLQQIAKAALDAGTDVALSWKAAPAAARLAFVVPKVAMADQLRSPPEGLVLYRCI